MKKPTKNNAQKNIFNERVKSNKAITLIALIITIIVLLILAGVSIATLTGDNGLLTKAQEAKEQNEYAKEDDLRRLTAIEASTHLTKEDYYDVNRDKAVIPAGFAVSQVEGENVIDDGLVIIDKNGNEFVWVPVDNYNDFMRRAGYSNGELQIFTSTSYGEADDTGVNPRVIESTTTQTEAKGMYKSVYDNGGFYIGRYETGKDDNGNIVIQKGVNVYNNITWSKNGLMNESSTEIAEEVDGTKDGAIEIARNFDTINSYVEATSTLCYGVQWDAVMAWLDSKYKTGTCDINTSFVANSTGNGNYDEDSNKNSWRGNVSLAGSSPDYEKNNIYDLAGNIQEWTMESYYGSYRICRGGNYVSTGGLDSPASSRGLHGNPYYSSNGVGFRIALYV